MRNKVIAFLQETPENINLHYNHGLDLYLKSDNKAFNIERTLNLGYSESRLLVLKYELQKNYQITDLELLTPAINNIEVEAEIVTSNEEESASQEVKKDLDTEETETEKENFKPIREEFTFLSNEDCPQELKILVADKITAWKRYTAAHQKIQDHEAGILVLTNEELTAIGAEATSNFEENQKIYNELNAYKNTGVVLGEHPIFKKIQLQREVDAMTPDELVKFKTASAKYFSTNKTDLSKAKLAKDENKIQIIQARVADRSEKLFLVNKKLGI